MDFPVDLDISHPQFFEDIESCDGLLAPRDRCTGSVILCNVPTQKHKILPFYLND